jgi:serine phosphatase RsbU (regulator of sigma subunit)
MNGCLARLRNWLSGNGKRGLAASLRPRRSSLRLQFTLRILMVLVPAFSLSYVVLDRLAAQEISRLARLRLTEEAELLSYGLREWGRSNRLILQALALHPALRQRDLAGSEALLQSLQRLYPYRNWRYWSTDRQPRLLAYSAGALPASVRQKMEANILHRDYFQEALQGRSGYGVVNTYMSNKACMTIAQPVYPERPAPSEALVSGLAASPGGRPTGVLVSCILLQDLAADTGLQAALIDPDLAGLQGADGVFRRQKPIRSAFVLLGRQGHVLYPTTRGVHAMLPSAKDYAQGYWGPLFRIATQAAMQKKEIFQSVRVGQANYFVLVNHADTAWSTMLILNQNYAFSRLHIFLNQLARYGGACLLLASLAVYWQCGRIIAPIRAAGTALQRISEGDFETRMLHDRSDEIGHLLDNINHTAEQLKLFLTRETAHAITQKQLETARVIQKDFLVSEIPESEHLEIAPIFLPAYEIGADWYDAMHIEDNFYVVVADVCDKGIPSALYMSVFRSLLRFGLLAYPGIDVDPGVRLQQVVSRVNDYMATNQGDSMMFATMFLAAVNPEKRELHYLSAGHEMTLIHGPAGLRSLAPTGPALGLFAGASFTAQKIDLEPGAVVVAYTDGLTDARSPEDQSWGHEALVHFLQAREGYQANASRWRDELVAAVQEHMAGADPFDDLTVMVLRLRA